MTTFTSTAREPRSSATAALSFIRPAAVTALVFPLALLLSWPHLVTIWQTGAFFDTDDAMRAVQVRDWMAGQGWFDLTAYRIDPPSGMLIHWSRVVDVPLALLFRSFRFFADPDRAERLMRITFPLALQAGMIAATAWVASLLAGRSAILPAALLLLMSGFTYAQFQPGRIDHHAPQILLIMLMTGTTLASLDPARARLAVLTGLFAAMSLAIGLENTPFIAVILATPPLAWAAAGDAHRRALLFLALGLGLFVPLLFVATVGPARAEAGSCLAFSHGHLWALVAGALGLATIAVSSPHWRGAPVRFIAIAAVGAGAVAVLHTTDPACLRDPYAVMSPLVKQVWLSNVTEAQPLATAMAERPAVFTVLVCPMLAGALAAFVALWRSRGLGRARWGVIAMLIALGFAGLAWQLRVSTTLQPFALLGGAWAVALLVERVAHRPVALAVLPLAGLLGFSSFGWALVPTAPLSAQAEAALDGGRACRDPRNLAPLAGLAPGTAFAPIDSGPLLLAHTRLAVLGAPYLNERGNVTVLRGFLANPEAAEAIVKGSGARYVLLCSRGAQVQVMAQEAPGGLAARLVAGDVPPWLDPIPLEGTLFRAYRVR